MSRYEDEDRTERMERIERRQSWYGSLDREQRAWLKIFALITVIVVLLVVALTCVINVPAGNKGVAVAGFGVGHQWNEGWHFKNPLTTVEMERYNTQEIMEIISVRSADGYNVDVDFTVRYHLLETQVGHVRVQNPEYVDTVIRPTIRSQGRKVVADWNLTGEQMSLQRSQYEDEVELRVTESLLEYDIVVEAVPIRNIDFPFLVNEAWELRVAAEVDVQTAEFELMAVEQRALQEVMRAQAEANSTVILAVGQAEALQLLANEAGSYDEGTMQYILSLRYITALRDPETNVEFVILSDGNNPFILNLNEMTNPTNTTAR